MDRRQLLEVVNQCERVRELLATSIQAGVRRFWDYDISLADARVLARVHTLATALEQIREKLNVHAGIASLKLRMQMAVNEVMISGFVNKPTRMVIDKIKQTRAQVIDLAADDGTARADQQVIRSELFRIGRRISSWAASYGHFLREIGNLYRRRRQELEALHLEPNHAKQAAEELDQIFTSAVERSDRITD